MYHVHTLVECNDEPQLAVQFSFENQPSEGDVERAQNAAVAAFWSFYGDDRSCSVTTDVLASSTVIDNLTGVLRS